MDSQVKDLVSLAQWRAMQHPHQMGYAFLAEDGETCSRLTYTQLDGQAKRVAAWLQHHHVAQGERVLLLFPPGLDYIVAFWGCLYAGVIAVPIYPPRRTRVNRFVERFYSVIEDSQATVALTTASLHRLIDGVLTQHPQSQPFQVLDTDAIPESLNWHEFKSTDETIALIQYTSGTTAVPKGVVLSHGNLMHNLHAIYRAFGANLESRGAIWLPPYHDMGLIGGILAPLYGGFPVTLIAPTTFLQSPFRWLDIISRTQATISGGPNFAYDLCVQKISPEQRAQLNLSCWKVAFNGAEPIQPATLRRFSETFAPVGFRQEAFYPCYGLAEATLMVTSKYGGSEPLTNTFLTHALLKHEVAPAITTVDDSIHTLVDCGQSISQQEIAIVDPQTHQRLEDHQVGEIWIHGPSVAQGYWRKSQETREIFQATILGDGTRPFLRTGDLGFFSSGRLYVTGRIKDLIIIRGLNYYPQDIEFTMGRCHAALVAGNGAAFTITRDGEQLLVVVHELERTYQSVDLSPILQAVSQAIYREYELQPYSVVLIRTGSLPRTTSGKIQRRLCRDLYLQGQLRVISETSHRSAEIPAVVKLNRESLTLAPAEQRFVLLVDYLQTQVAQILRQEIQPELLQQPLIALGLDSLQSAELVYHVQHDLQVALSIETLLDDNSIEQLAHIILYRVTNTHIQMEDFSAESVDGAGQKLSYGEQGLWFLQHTQPDDSSYTITRTVRLSTRTDLSLLEKSIHALFMRHKALTTIFPLTSGKPVRSHISPEISYFKAIDTTDWKYEEIQQYLEEAACYAFDLEKGPLCQVILLNDAVRRPLLVFIIHHIIMDAYSLAILLEELGVLYTAACLGTSPELPSLSTSYPDFVLWQTQRLQGEQRETFQSYWQQQLRALPPKLDLPLASTRQPGQTNKAGTEHLTIDARMLAQIKALCQQEGVTLSMFFLAAFATLLHRYTEQKDLVISTPFFGRNHHSFARLVGYFVNILPLRIDLSGQPTFLMLLQQVKQVALAAMNYQDYPFSLLVHDQQSILAANQSVLEQITFVMQNIGSITNQALAPLVLGEAGPEIALGQLYIEPVETNVGSAQRDLSLSIAEFQEKLLVHLEYNRSLLPSQTMQYMLANLATLVQNIINSRHSKLIDLAFISPEEQRLLERWNEYIEQPAGYHLCLHHLFSCQAYITPDAVALVFEDQSFSYGQIERQTNQLAHFLQSQGIGPDMLVGLCTERTPELIIGILGILKAGGAYLPLDPAAPEERLSLMILDSQLKVVLTQKSLLVQLPTIIGTRLVCLDTNWLEIARMPTNIPRSEVVADNLAYIIYTSGSTGRPKGTMITHNNVMRLLTATYTCLAFGRADTWSLFHSYAFDFSVWEIWGALAYGGRLVIVPYWLSRSPQAFVKLVTEQGVTIMNQTPSAFQQFVEQVEHEKLARGTFALSCIIFGGEALDPALPQRWFASYGDQHPQLVNMYGITETTVHVTYHLSQQSVIESDNVGVIGRPISDLQVYILDGQQQLLPVGSVGEIYVGGAGLARGYLDQPALTSERFIPHPFSSQPGKRLYRTGDLARYRTDGTIEYLGRTDHQVKIRGFRIELGEIENVLNEHPAIQQSLVIAQEETPGHKYLVAYYTATPAQVQPPMFELRNFLSRRLPAYMLPATFLQLPSFPLTINGKIDQRALPPPPRQRHSDLDGDYMPPQTLTEATMVAIWQNVLGKEPIGINDNFFEVGGDSIHSIQIVAQARSAGLICTVRQLFLYQTVRELAVHLQEVADEAQPSQIAPFSLLSDADNARLSDKKQVKDAYPLTMLQAGLVFHSQFSPDYELYVTSMYLKLPFQQELFRQALAFITTRHEMLRTCFDLSTFSETIQLIHEQAEADLEVYDLCHLSSDQQERVINEWIEQEKKRSFSWEKLPLVRFFVHLRTEQTIQLTLSEPFFDGWSVASLLTELLKCYGVLLQQQLLPEPTPLATTFRDYVVAERQQLANESSQRFWLQTLQNATIHTLPRDHPSKQEKSKPRICRLVVPVSADLSDQVKQVARQNKLPLKSLLLGVHLKVLSLLHGSSDVITGVIFNGRTEIKDGERVLGLFLNALPLRLYTGAGSWLELVQRALEAEQAILPYRRYPIAKIQQLIGSQNLFETVFNYTHFHAYQPLEQLEQIQVLGGYASEQTYFPLTTQCNLDHTTSDIRIVLDYSTAILTEAQVATIAGYYVSALQNLAACPHMCPDNAALLQTQERRNLLHSWNKTDDAAIPVANFLTWFESQVEQRPAHVALICGDRKMTYQQLYQQASHLASGLLQRGIGPDTCVGVCLERSCELIVALLGILLAGGAYVPLDPLYPVERLSFMVQDAGIGLVITQEHQMELLPVEKVETILLHSDAFTTTDISPSVPSQGFRQEHLSHIIYTSGSTGLPKGVEITRGSVSTLIQWALSAFTPDQLSYVLASTSVCFDLSVFEIFVPLSSGGTVVLVQDVLHLPAIAQTLPLSLINTVPSVLSEILREHPLPASVQVINLAGEALPRQLVEKLYRQETLQEIYNLYGPSEDTTYSTYALIERNSALTPPIGRPISGTHVYVLDDQMQIVPVGVPGELYIGGMGLARGYRQRPELTAERFVPNPFAETPGSRLYRTGDLVRFQENGRLEYLQRLDHQVKIRGFRIELNEIETVLTQHANVHEAVVLVREDTLGQKRLTAYLILQPLQEISLGDLRDFLKQRLPHYMLPADFVVLDAFPVTLSGKIDRRALQMLEVTFTQATTPFVPPETASEKAVAQIWAEILQLPAIGLYDNFFSLGGHSLSATQIVSRLRTHFSVDLTMAMFFEAPTLKELAHSIEQLQITENDNKLQGLFAQIQMFSDEEVTRMLLERGITLNKENGSVSTHEKS